MIIEARGDVITLSGSLDRNLWPSIQSAAHMLLRQHPSGILLDAGKVESCNLEGVKTFMDAMSYIEKYRARIVLCEVPPCVSEMIKIVPGVRSQVAIAASCAEGRASLELATAMREKAGRLQRRPENGSLKPRAILVPLLPRMTEASEAVGLANVLGTVETEIESTRMTLPPKGHKKIRPIVHLAYIIEVPRSIPLKSPLPEEEDEARKMLSEAEGAALQTGVHVETHVIRTRDAAEEIAVQARRIEAELIVVSMPSILHDEDDPLREIVRKLLRDAPCELIVKRPYALPV